MSRLLSTAERTEIVEIYNQSDSAAQAARTFSDRHLERAVPLSRSSVINIVEKFRRTGSVADNYKRGRKSILLNAEAVQNITQRFETDPHLSIRQASAQLHHSKNTIHKVLKAEEYHPYKYQKHQKLLPTDYASRLQFSDRFTEQLIGDVGFQGNVLYTDECIFTLNGAPNKQTYRYIHYLRSDLIKRIVSDE